MPLYEYQCDACHVALKSFGSSRIPSCEVCTLCGKGSGAAADVVTGDSVQGIGLVYHRLFAEGESDSESTGTPCTRRLEASSSDPSTTKTDTAAPAAKPAASD